MHPDAVIAIAASADGERLTQRGLRRRDRLAAVAAAGLRPRPEARGDGEGPAGPQGHRPRRPRPVHLGRHGEGLLPADAATSSRRRPTTWRANGQRRAVRRRRSRSRSAEAGEGRLPDRSCVPALRGQALGRASTRSMHFTDAPEVMEFVNAARAEELAAIGTSCPDHFLRTKIWPLFVPFDPSRERPATCSDALDAAARRLPRSATRATTSAASGRRRPAMRDPYPVIVLVPGVGLSSFAKDKTTARVASEFYVNAINVMRGAEGVSAVRADPGAGGLRHRVLAAGGSEAAAAAEAEEPRGPDRARDRRRGRHRGERPRSVCWPRGPAWSSPTSTRRRSTRRRPRSGRSTGRTGFEPSAAT